MPSPGAIPEATRPPLLSHQPPGVGEERGHLARLAAPWARGCLLSLRGPGLWARLEGLPSAFRCRQNREARESGTHNQREGEVEKSRKESFIFKKQNNTRRPSAGFEDRGMHHPGGSPFPRPQAPCCPLASRRQDPRRAAQHAGQGGPGGSCSRETGTRAAPASAVRDAGHFQASLCSGHWALGTSLPGRAATRRLAHVTHTSYHGNAALRQTGPLARTTIPGMWGQGGT